MCGESVRNDDVEMRSLNHAVQGKSKPVHSGGFGPWLFLAHNSVTSIPGVGIIQDDFTLHAFVTGPALGSGFSWLVNPAQGVEKYPIRLVHSIRNCAMSFSVLCGKTAPPQKHEHNPKRSRR